MFNKKFQNRFMKKSTLGLTAAGLAAALSISAFAAQTANPAGGWDHTGIMAGTQMQSMMEQNGAMQRPEGGMQRPDGNMQRPEGNMQRPEGDMQRPEGNGPMEELKEKIEALSDTSVKEKITNLQEKLETAMEAERKLMDANRPEKPEGEQNADGTASDSSAAESKKADRPAFPAGSTDGQRPEMPAAGADGQRPEMPAAGANGQRPEMPAAGADGQRPEETEEMKAAREAVETARTALEEALKEAGIEFEFKGGRAAGETAEA